MAWGNEPQFAYWLPMICLVPHFSVLSPQSAFAYSDDEYITAEQRGQWPQGMMDISSLQLSAQGGRDVAAGGWHTALPGLPAEQSSLNMAGASDTLCHQIYTCCHQFVSAVKLLEAWLRHRNILGIPGLAQQHIFGMGAHRQHPSEGPLRAELSAGLCLVLGGVRHRPGTALAAQRYHRGSSTAQHSIELDQEGKRSL